MELDIPVTRIRPSRGWVALGLRELWEYRELLWFLVWRDVKVRYKQTVLGAGWAILQPIATMVVFSLFFGRLAGMPSDGLPYRSSASRRWCPGPSSRRGSRSPRTAWWAART
ncbi:MAG: ABC transporter permease [Thermoanaerobaculia bacterium]